jgi:hypothetical protein
MKSIVFLLLTLVAIRVCPANPCWTVEPVFYNSLESANAIVSGVPGEVWWHPGGQFLGGDFEPGFCHMAYRASADEDGLVSFPIDWQDRVFPVDGGMLDFRFRISGFSGPVFGAASPALVRLQDGLNTFGVWLGSDPAFEHFGVLGAAGLGNLAAGPGGGAMEYGDLMSQDVWHHCVLAWAVGGLPISGAPVVALYLDGQLHSQWVETGQGFGPLDPASRLILASNEQPFGQTSLESLRIWDLAYWPFPDWSESIQRLALDCEPVLGYCAEARETPMTAHLAGNHPNPFNPGTTIAFVLAETGPVRLEVYNLEGARVATLVDGLRSAGSHELVFDGTGLPSGVYYYRLETAGQVSTRAMTLIR